MPVVILISLPRQTQGFATTRINRFYTQERPSAMASLHLACHDVRLHGHRIAKFGNAADSRIFEKLSKPTGTIGALATQGGDGVLYYQEACRYWLKAMDGLPFFTRNGKRMEPPHGRVINFRTKNAASFVSCLLNSSLFYWYYSAFSDCEHVNDVLLRTFKVPEDILNDDWKGLARQLAKRLEDNASRKTINTKQGHTIQYDEMKASAAKDILDDIDRALGKWFGLSPEEIDVITSYDIKYRLGQDDGDDDAE